MMQREIQNEDWWFEKICPLMATYCYGSGCAFWVTAREENGVRYGACMK